MGRNITGGRVKNKRSSIIIDIVGYALKMGVTHVFVVDF